MNTIVSEHATDTATMEATLKGIVAQVLKLATPPSALTHATNLYELGLESLNVVELLTEIEIAFDVVIDIEDLSEEIFRTFGNLAAFVRSKIDAAR